MNCYKNIGKGKGGKKSMFISDSMSKNNKREDGEQDNDENENKEPLVTPFGGAKGVLTLTAVISQSSSQIIAFFTEQVNGAILSEFSGGEVLAIFFIVMFLLLSVVGPLRKLVSTKAGKGFGWRLTLGMFLDFVSKIVILLAFGYAARYLGITWTRLGLNLSEKIITTVSLAFIFFGIYAFYLSQYTSGMFG